MNTQHLISGVGAGLLVGHNVRLKRVLGRGGMGSVWVAMHEALQTEVAVKFISPEIATNPEAVARFKREATAAAQLRSPHVVQVFDHGVTAEGVPFIVMELLEGEDLATRIGRFGRLAVADVVSIVSQACKALGRAHARGIVHRDIKPENIFLVDTEGESFVKLLDFGIAKREDAGLGMTTTGTMVGTPYFMSPEQVMSARDVDLRCDLWSLAVVAYNALTGRVPFFAETLGGLCVVIHAGKFLPVTSDHPDLPAALDAWFKRALARDPAARFASAKELAETFARAAGTSPAEPVRTSLVSSPALAQALFPALQPGTLLGATVTHSGAPKVQRRAALVAVTAALAALAIGAGLVVSAAHEPPAELTAGARAAITVPGPPPSAAPVSVPPESAVVLALPAAVTPPASASAVAANKPVRRASRPKRDAPPPASAAAKKPAAPPTKKDKDYGF
jgi:eukaryotic-like serine/threonine-protein kinase